MLRTCHEWISKLAAESGVVAGMRLERDIGNADLDTDALNLANCDAHCRLITRAIDELVTHNFSSSKSARELLVNLINRPYGFFAELAAYDWLTRCNVKFATQVAMDSSDGLGTNRSTLDGKIERGSVYFEVKAFGSNEMLAQRLKERLEKEILDEEVLIEGSWDLSERNAPFGAGRTQSRNTEKPDAQLMGA